MIRVGRVLGIISGPPCETRSVARFCLIELDDVKFPPRPLRSRTMPWAKNRLTPKEYQQVSAANVLLQATELFTLELL